MRSIDSMHSLAEQTLHEHLESSQTSLQILRRRIKVAWFALAVLLGFGLEIYRFRHPGTMSEDGYLWDAEALKIFAFYTTFNLRLILLSLAPLIDDMAFIRIIVATDMLVVEGELAVRFYHVGFGEPSQTMELLSSFYGRGLVFGAFCIRAFFSRCIIDAQRRMWLGLGAYAAYIIVLQFFWSVQELICLGYLSRDVIPLFTAIPLLYVALNSRLRNTVQAQILHWMEGKAAARGAASLACLVGSVPPGEAIRIARHRFRCIEYDQFVIGMMASNRPDPAYSALAQPQALGSCDAFLSHSWHDDAQAKWDALQLWSASFSARNGRQPSLWFDKLCIDQSDITMDLRCLPIFLMGCSRLVVLCGPTYLSRLWCVLEIFTHVHLCGCAENIDLVQMLREGHEIEDAKAIEDAFDNFDARDCQCFNSRDKKRILAIIDAAFGNMEVFNCSVQGIARQVKKQLTTMVSIVPSSTNLSAAGIDSTASWSDQELEV